MSTYNPASFPRRSKLWSLAGEVRYQSHLMYYRYEINTGLYVMSPGEKLAFNILNLFIATLMFSAICYFAPAVLTAPIRHLAYQLGSHLSSRSVQRAEIHEAILQARIAGEAVASLTHGRNAVNASMAVPACL
ncbi:hypothetical protein Q7P37_006891 [Cladosporium fusiforme]